MTEAILSKLSDFLPLQSFIHKPVFSIQDGTHIDNIVDIMVDPQNLTLAALILEKEKLLRPEFKAVLAEEVKVWGKDAVLITRADIIQDKDSITDFEKWVSLDDDVRGRNVISMEGVKVGEIKDLLIDSQGKILGVDVLRSESGLSQFFNEETSDSNQQLPAASIHSLGEDAMLVDFETDENHAG